MRAGSTFVFLNVPLTNEHVPVVTSAVDVMMSTTAAASVLISRNWLTRANVAMMSAVYSAIYELISLTRYVLDRQLMDDAH